MAEPESRTGRSRRRPRVRVAKGLSDRLGGALLGVSIVSAVLLIGAQHTEVLLPVAALAAASALLLRSEQAPALVWVLLGLATYTLLQLVPLPFAWVEALSPAGAEVWRGALRPLGSPAPRFIPLSVDPGATALESVKWFGYACVLLAASGWRARHGASALALLVFGSALAVATVTLAHGIVEAPRIYGLFVPIGPFRWTRGPLINANALAGYLNLGLFAGLGVWLARRDAKWAQLIPLGIAVLAVSVFLTRSRGGVGGLCLGAAVFGLLVLRQRRTDWRRIGAVVAGALLSLLGALFLGGAELRAELFDVSFGAKATAWRWALGLLRDFPVFGVGRGAFETAFQPYRQPLGSDSTLVFAHAENFPLEWLCDWGVPVGLVAIGGCLASIPAIARRAMREPMAVGLFTGLGVLFLQNLVDLALEVFAVTATALVAFAAIHSPRAAVRGWRAWRAWPVVAALGVVVGSLIVMVTGAAPVKIERDRLSAAYKAFVSSRARDPRALVAELRASILRHPGEAYFPVIGALVSRRTSRGDPLRWLARALERGPMNGNAHLLLAQVLAERGKISQAMIHVRLTALYDVILQDHALHQAGTWAKSAEELIAVFPRGLPGSELIDDLCDKARPEARVGCWKEAVDRNPSVRARHRLAGALLDRLEEGVTPCVGDAAARCGREIEALLGAIPIVERSFLTALLRARLLAARGDVLRAVQAVLEGCPATPEAAECVERGLDLGRRANDLTALATVADRYLAIRCGEQTECAKAHERIGSAYGEMGAWAIALRHFSAATKADPNTERWLRSAEAAARIGSILSAQTSLERARSGGELSAAQRDRLAAIEALLAGGAGL
jgi:tetratricopeptide (TPR) repeat protein/O-antigen ligase